MANANIHPICPDTIQRLSLLVSVANTNRDGTTGTYAQVIATAGARGAIVPEVRAIHAGAIGVASTAMVLRLWHRIGGAGNRFLIDEVTLPAVTPSASAIGATAVFNRTNIALKALDTLEVTQSIAESVHYQASAGDY